MSEVKGTGDASSPDKYVQRDVTDLRIEFGKFDERLQNLKDNMVTKEEFANSKLEAAKWIVQILVPLVAVAIGALLGFYLNNLPSS